MLTVMMGEPRVPGKASISGAVAMAIAVLHSVRP